MRPLVSTIFVLGTKGKHYLAGGREGRKEEREMETPKNRVSCRSSRERRCCRARPVPQAPPTLCLCTLPPLSPCITSVREEKLMKMITLIESVCLILRCLGFLLLYPVPRTRLVLRHFFIGPLACLLSCLLARARARASTTQNLVLPGRITVIRSRSRFGSVPVACSFDYQDGDEEDDDVVSRMSGQPWGHWNSPQPPNQQEQQNQGYYTGYPGQQQQQQQQHQAQHAPHDYQMQRGPQQQHQQQYHHQQQQQGRPQLQHYQSHQAMYGVSPHQQQYRQHQQQQHVMQQMHHQHQYHGNPQHHQPPPPQQQQHPHPHQFMFNPNANVFVPGGRYGMPPPQQQQQQYYGGGAMHSNMHSFQPNYGAPQSSGYNMYQEDPGFDAFAQFGQQSQQYMPSPELFALMQGNASSLLNEILVGCEQLLAEGEEDSATWTAAIRQRFADAKMDEEAKRTGVKLIVEMAFSMEPNQFRGTDPQYTFSNLLKTLAAELKDFLRDVVLPVLGEINEARKSLEHDSRVYLAVFYAELFVKLTLNNGSRFEKLGDALATQIDEILKFQQKDDYMKCLLRAFKVAGAELDASETLRTRVDQILTTMGGYAKGSPILGESVKAQILSLIECRQRGWDRSVTSGVETTSSSGGAASGVVYGDDSFDESLDNELTEEERQFLESHLEQAERNDSQAAGGGGDELDEQEVMNEFGKFVKEELLKAEEAKTADLLSNLSVNDEPAEEAAAEQQPEQH